MRYKCTVSYDGTMFHGFQTQDNLRTVQEEIEKVLLIINKKYRITIEKYAQKDIESIYNYICTNLVNKEAAIKLLNKINEKFDTIALFPKSAPLLNNDYVTNKNIRKLLIDNYIAFYEVDDINKEIRIIRIIYGMQNYIDVL